MRLRTQLRLTWLALLILAAALGYVAWRANGHANRIYAALEREEEQRTFYDERLIDEGGLYDSRIDELEHRAGVYRNCESDPLVKCDLYGS